MYSRSPRFSDENDPTYAGVLQRQSAAPGPATYSPKEGRIELPSGSKPVKRRVFFRLARHKENLGGVRREPPLPPHIGPNCNDVECEGADGSIPWSERNCSYPEEERVKGFGSCVGRESYFEEQARLKGVPSPNAYELCLKKLGAISFGASRTRRFQSASTCVPGPAEYQVARSLGRNKSAPPCVNDDLQNRRLKQASIASPKTKTSPSIPYRDQTMGYVSGRDGKLHLRRNPMRQFRYTKMPAHEDLTAPNKGTSFAQSQGHGKLFTTSDTPSPGSYATMKSLHDFKRQKGKAQHENIDSARFGTLLFRDAMRKAIPGPGSYDDYRNYRLYRGFDMGLATSRLYQATNPFSSSNCESHPGPGSYEIDKKPKVRWSPVVTRKSANAETPINTAQPSFLSSEKRFYEIFEECKSPGPGQYSVERKLDASSVKYDPAMTRITDFGYSEETPGPAAYDTAGDIASRSVGAKESKSGDKAQKSKSRKTMIVHIFSKTPLPPAPFTSRADRFDSPVGSGAPGPSAYDAAAASQAKYTYGKIGSRYNKHKGQNRPPSNTSKPMAIGAQFLDSRVDFAPSPGGEFLKLPVTPGPANYSLNDEPIHSRAPHTVVGGAPRLVEPENRNPAPNTYNARADLVRKTYNKTLGAKITNPYRFL